MTTIYMVENIDSATGHRLNRPLVYLDVQSAFRRRDFIAAHRLDPTASIVQVVKIDIPEETDGINDRHMPEPIVIGDVKEIV